LTGHIVKTGEFYFAKGGFSEIFKGEWTDPDTGEMVRVAIKILSGVHTDRNVLATVTTRLNRETRVWHSLSHENVMPFLGLCHGVGPSPAMISRLYDNGDVHQYLKRKPQVDRLAIIIGVARGLQYLHSQKVVHGDFKGHNILIDDDGTPLVADFGRSKLIEHRGFTTVTSAGSARQTAPELVIIDESEDPPELTQEADVYAFSMVVLEILTGKPPFFSARLDMTILFRVRSGGRPERKSYPPTTLTDSMWALLVDCWDQVPQKRPDMGAVVRRLEAM